MTTCEHKFGGGPRAPAVSSTVAVFKPRHAITKMTCEHKLGAKLGMSWALAARRVNVDTCTCARYVPAPRALHGRETNFHWSLFTTLGLLCHYTMVGRRACTRQGR
jgi:hypothetical protein